ncbi:hypothetical protein DMA11_20625 [Marinilabiliaceae bacterium JC017]|nr:hypothetical protein DMA11_20625 [Marinilabiliaceae bacterium JC017]
MNKSIFRIYTVIILFCVFCQVANSQKNTLSLGDNAVNNGEGNIFFGASSGNPVYDNPKSSHNTFLGIGTGYGQSINLGNVERHYNTFLGSAAGAVSDLRHANVCLGRSAGMKLASILKEGSSYNIFLGYETGSNCKTGDYNFFAGYRAGVYAEAGNSNIMIGLESGAGMVGYGYSDINPDCFVQNSILIGTHAGFEAYSNSDICIGESAGEKNDGQNNIFIGKNAGKSREYSNKLIISNDVGQKRPLLEGDFSQCFFSVNGKMGINKNIPEYELDVDGVVRATAIKIKAHTADFVFDDNYVLRPLNEVDQFIAENNHLPDIPSAAQMEEDGVNMAEMNKLLLQKIEELTLYMINQEKRIKELESRIQE